MAKLNFVDAVKEQEKVIKSREQTLAKGLTQPFNSTISGARKNLSSTQRDHVMCLYDPEFPLISTGYEDRFGETSSSFNVLPEDYQVLGKVIKTSQSPLDHFWLIMQNQVTKELDVIERKRYHYITESYGYIHDTKYMDRLTIGDIAKKDDVISKSISFDDYNNYRNGVNLRTAYISCDATMEDAILIGKSAADKLKAPLFRKVLVFANDNDIFLNLYGDSQVYKPFPYINEHINEGILCALRREQREESLFTQSCDRLMDVMMSDTKYTLNGRVIDINVYCNNPEELKNSFYNSQVYYYYLEQLRYCNEIINIVKPLIDLGYTMSYDLQKLYYNSQKILNGAQYVREGKAFSNIVIEFIVEEESTLEQGDKLSDRYGGKGVVGSIVPDEYMPQLDNGERVEIIFNSSTCVNRLNPGQLFETSLTHIGCRLIEFMESSLLDYDECLAMYIDYIKEIAPLQAAYIENYIFNIDESEMAMFISSIMQDGGLLVSVKPISESMTIDDLDRLYKVFPWVKPYTLSVPIMDSNGSVRYVDSRRSIISGKKYIYRLKQYAEDKFSATSLSATNIRNENSRSKANKEFKGVFTKTPIRFGEMETGDLGHLGMEHVIINLMIHSASPHARRLTSQLLSGDPFNIDIKLDQDSSNRNVEILNSYLKTMGLRLVFNKVYKKMQNPVLREPITKLDMFMRSPVMVLPEGVEKAAFYQTKERKEGYTYPVSIVPIQKLGTKKFRKENGYD